MNQGAMEKCQPANGDTPCQVPGDIAANFANANKNRTVVVPGFGTYTVFMIQIQNKIL